MGRIENIFSLQPHHNGTLSNAEHGPQLMSICSDLLTRADDSRAAPPAYFWFKACEQEQVDGEVWEQVDVEVLEIALQGHAAVEPEVHWAAWEVPCSLWWTPAQGQTAWSCPLLSQWLQQLIGKSPHQDTAPLPNEGPVWWWEEKLLAPLEMNKSKYFDSSPPGFVLPLPSLC